jgi:hypothetical protein
MDDLHFPTFLTDTVFPLFTALGCGAGGNLLIDWTVSQDGVLATEVGYQLGAGNSGWHELGRFEGSAHAVLALTAMKAAVDAGLGAVVAAVQRHVDPATRKGYFVCQFRSSGPVLRLHTERFQVSIAEHDGIMDGIGTLIQTLQTP